MGPAGSEAMRLGLGSAISITAIAQPNASAPAAETVERQRSSQRTTGPRSAASSSSPADRGGMSVAANARSNAAALG